MNIHITAKYDAISIIGKLLNTLNLFIVRVNISFGLKTPEFTALKILKSIDKRYNSNGAVNKMITVIMKSQPLFLSFNLVVKRKIRNPTIKTGYVKSVNVKMGF